MAVENVGNFSLPKGNFNVSQSKSGNLNAPLGTGKSTDFEKLMRKGVDQVNTRLNDADVEAKKLLSGKSGNLHEVMIGLEKADVSFKFMMKVRNKVVQAYQEVMRMNV